MGLSGCQIRRASGLLRRRRPAVHGERPAAGPEDRAFRAAFVCFSDTPLSSARMDALERWAAIFGNDLSQPGLFSFESGTGGRATMSTRLGPVH